MDRYFSHCYDQTTQLCSAAPTPRHHSKDHVAVQKVRVVCRGWCGSAIRKLLLLNSFPSSHEDIWELHFQMLRSRCPGSYLLRYWRCLCAWEWVFWHLFPSPNGVERSVNVSQLSTTVTNTFGKPLSREKDLLWLTVLETTMQGWLVSSCFVLLRGWGSIAWVKTGMRRGWESGHGDTCLESQSLGKWKLKDLELKVILRNIVSLGPAWTIGYSVSGVTWCPIYLFQGFSPTMKVPLSKPFPRVLPSPCTTNPADWTVDF